MVATTAVTLLPSYSAFEIHPPEVISHVVLARLIVLQQQASFFSRTATRQKNIDALDHHDDDEKNPDNAAADDHDDYDTEPTSTCTRMAFVPHVAPSPSSSSSSSSTQEITTQHQEDT
jgi:hypothetical protein